MEKNIEKGENKMKRFIAFALVLVLVLSLVATSFAAYYPTVKFDAKSKKQTVKYGKKFTMKYKLNDGSGPFNRVRNIYGGWIWRANFDVYLKTSTQQVKISDYDFTGNPTLKVKYKTKKYFQKPTAKKCSCYVVATSYYRSTVGSTVYSLWHKNKSTKTKLYIRR